MSHPSRNNIGAHITPTSTQVPLANSAGTRNSAAVDRLGYGSLTIVSHAGAVTGSPSDQTLDVKLQESADGSTGWTDVSGAAFAQKTSATASLRTLDVNLAGVARYVRVVEVIAMTSGTSPTYPHSACVILGGKNKLPAN